MASVSKDAKGYRIFFLAPDGRRRSIRISGLNKAKAQQVSRHVAELVNAKTSAQSIDRQTALWLSDIGKTLRDKLVSVGLVEARESSNLKQCVADYIAAGRTASGRVAKPLTIRKWQTTAGYLNEFFGDCMLDSVSLGKADDFRRWLAESKGNAENTVRKHIQIVKLFFTAAKRRRLIDENPFQDQKSTTMPNRQRDYFVTQGEIQKCLDACPDSQWQLIIALCRFGGLRCPSEVLQLTWDDVLWDQNRIHIKSPKTEHHEGKRSPRDSAVA